MFLRGAKWTKWSSLNDIEKSERVTSTIGFITSLYNIKGVEFTDEEIKYIEGNVRDYYQSDKNSVLRELHTIIRANNEE